MSIKKELFPICLLLFTLFIAIIIFDKSLDKIPVHWNLKGEIDGYGGKYALFISPITSLFIYLLFSFLQNRPDICNYPTQIRSKEKAHKAMGQFLWLMKILTMALFLFIEIGIYLNELYFFSLGIPSLLVVIIITIIHYIRKLSKS